jgi:hypothetical protein
LVFLNVRQTGATTIQYLSGSNVLTTATVPVGGESVPVFDGVLYTSPVVTGVRITFGGGPIFNFDGVFAAAVNSDVAPTNLVAADDLVQAEPTVEAPNIGATAGAPFSGRLDSFTDPDPNAQPGDFTATIDWGDGRRSTAAVTGSTSLGFSVAGGHTYSQAGTFAVTVTDQDTGGAERVIHFLAEVGTRSTTTGMSCSPATVRVGTASTCTATVTDIAAGSASAPSGTIGFTSPAGGGFASGASCTLVARSATASSCSTTFSPIRTGSVLGAYSGDSAHAASRGAGALAAFGHGCTLGVPSPKLPAHARTLRILTLCDQAVTVKLAATAMIARHGSRRGGKVSLGTATGRVSANRAATLVLHPSARTLAVLRSAAGHHQPISLALSLTATASTTTKATLTLPALKVS